MEVTASCKRCKTAFGVVHNRWRQMTGSYYVEADATPDGSIEPYDHIQREGLDLRDYGEAKSPGRKNGILKDCLVQALACRSCTDRFAFQCVAAPQNTKDRFKNRIFFKLSKIILQDSETDQPVSASLERGAEASWNNSRISSHSDDTLEHITSTDSHRHGDTGTGPSQSPHVFTGRGSLSLSVESDMPVAIARDSLLDADDEAARQILAEATWQDVHDSWERKTKVTLSPASFGDRILPVVERHKYSAKTMDKPRPMQRELPPLQRPDSRSAEHRVSSNGRSPHHDQLDGSRYHAQRPDTLEAQRADINRIDAAVNDIQSSIRDLKAIMNSIRQELQSRPQRISEDSRTLNLLSETVGQMASKTGEVDGIKFNIATLTRRVKSLEETSNPTSTASRLDSSYTRPGSSATYGPVPSSHSRPSVLPPSQSQSIAPAPAWSAVNSQHSQTVGHHKRKSMSLSGSEGSHKDFGALAKRSRPANSHHASSESSTAGRPPQSTMPAPAPPTLAPIRSLPGDSRDSWVPESQRLPSIRGMPENTRGGRRGSSHGPRASSVDDLGTPAWEHDSWNENQAVDPDGYYRPLGGGPPISPTTAERRGNIIRRGSGGGLHYMDNFNNKRTRQKPIRNSDGVLIRKDGKPDQRSISSPQNLKKVHARKIAEQESSTSPHFPSPLGFGRHDSQEGSASSGEVSQFASPTQSEHQQNREGSAAAQHHNGIMGKMFPHGVAADAERMNHAAHLFSAVNAKGGRQRASTLEAQPRGDMMHDDVHSQHQQEKESAAGAQQKKKQVAAGNAEDTDEYEPMAIDEPGKDTPARDMPPPTSAPARKSREDTPEQPASGSVYEPSQTQTTEPSAAASETTRSTAGTESVVGR